MKYRILLIQNPPDKPLFDITLDDVTLDVVALIYFTVTETLASYSSTRICPVLTGYGSSWSNLMV